MNYYERHIGDYLKDTVHLSLLEHGVYARLLDVYYTREVGIDERMAARLIGARSKDELAALHVVLSEFFALVDGVYLQARCDREIERYQKKAERNREVGKLGGRPKKTATQTEPTNNPGGFKTEPTDNPLQSPVTSNQEKKTHTSVVDDESGVSFEGFEPTKAGAICTALRLVGIEGNPAHPVLAALIDAGATAAEFVGAAPKSIGKTDRFAYVLTTLTKQRQAAAELVLTMARGASDAVPKTVPSGDTDATQRLLAAQADHARIAESQRLVRLANRIKATA